MKEKMKGVETGNSNCIIARGTFIKGNVRSNGNIRIEGKIVGDIITDDKVSIGESSFIEGKIEAKDAEVAGEVKGKLEITNLLTLKNSSVINGNIITNKLEIESGAVFKGNCKTGTKQKPANTQSHA